MEAKQVQLLRGIRLDLKPTDLLFTNPTTTAICQEFTDIKCISITTTAICQEFTDIKCISINFLYLIYHTFHFLYYLSLYMEIEFDR
jgi:hypothetical protein